MVRSYLQLSFIKTRSPKKILLQSGDEMGAKIRLIQINNLKQQKKGKIMQNKTCFNTYRLITKVLNTPYNWSLVLMTVIIWAFSGNWFS